MTADVLIKPCTQGMLIDFMERAVSASFNHETCDKKIVACIGAPLTSTSKIIISFGGIGAKLAELS